MTSQQLASETALCDLPDRIVVASAHGRLVLSAPQRFTAEGELVRAGDVLATIAAGAESIEVCAPCDAWVLRFLAEDRDRVRPGLPVVHLREL